MAGAIIELFGRRTFTFTNLAASGFVTLSWVLEHPIERFTEGTLLMRCHAHTLPSGSGGFRLRLYATAPSRSDPQIVFYDDRGLLAETSLTPASPPAPTLLMDDVAVNFGGFVLVELTVVQSSSPGTLSAVLSADLVVKRRPWG